MAVCHEFQIRDLVSCLQKVSSARVLSADPLALAPRAHISDSAAGPGQAGNGLLVMVMVMGLGMVCW